MRRPRKLWRQLGLCWARSRVKRKSVAMPGYEETLLSEIEEIIAAIDKYRGLN